MCTTSDRPQLSASEGCCVFIGHEYISSYISISDDCLLKFANSQHYPPAPFAKFYRVTDEALIAETAGWPNLFLMNVFFAIKGSKLFLLLFLVDSLCCTLSIQIKERTVNCHTFLILLSVYLMEIKCLICDKIKTIHKFQSSIFCIG